MGWPNATDYSSAIQNPGSCFADEDLARGAAAADAILGLPLAWSGNFASVYKVVCGEQTWAVKCFTREVRGLQRRYASISQHLQQVRRKFSVEFHYLERGIRVAGGWYPVVKMRWVEGFTLNEFVREYLGNPGLIAQLGALWLRLAGELRESRMAHGDLQHGNVLLVPGTKASALVLRLIDYDGTWVPDLAGSPSGEVGHPNYQHPDRLREGGYSAEIDRFAHLVIYTALRCVAAGGKALWNRFDNEENLLFKEADFRDPTRSKLWPELFDLPDPQLNALAGHLLDASQRPLSEVPLLGDVLDGTEVRPLSGEQVARLRKVLPSVRLPEPQPAFSGLDWLPRPPVPAGVPQTVPPVPVTVVLPLDPDVVVVSPTPIRDIVDALPVEVLPVEEPYSPPRPKSSPVLLPPVQPLGGPYRPPPPPTPPPLPWPELPANLRLGLPVDNPLVRFWPVTLGVVLSLALMLLVGTVLRARLGRAGAGRPAVSARITGIRPVFLRAGHRAEMRLTVERTGNPGPLRLVAGRLPPGVTCPAVDVPPGAGPHEVVLTFTPSPEAGNADGETRFTLHSGGEKLFEQAAPLIVREFLRPRITGVLPAPLQVTGGQTTTAVVLVDPRGNRDPWSVRVEGLGKFEKLITTAAVPAAPRPGVPSVAVTVTAAANAPAMMLQLTVVLLADGLEAHRFPVTLKVEKGPRAMAADLILPDDVQLVAGDRALVDVRVVRFNHDGPLKVWFEGLPPGVTSEPVLVEPGRPFARLVLSAQANAGGPLALSRIRVVAAVGEVIVGTRVLNLHVIIGGRGQGGFPQSAPRVADSPV